ncbi:hypothetical protein PCC6912_25230 [Chlorogloeopsis fritschii PCC 6912]|uniref:Uncharacterized protein n=1 Tax=Chlorogloeopsis fritschii PCC 6912 TaxID=211165 RepID=A0A433NKE2_CHLFR|nr:hypothetical protein PCC6912_25230 [Chlorogloeopsis fritschii PCC 6912]
MATSTGTTVLNLNSLSLNVCTKDMGISKGHKVVVTTNITKDRKFSAGQEAGWRRENLK